jgi:aquaporin Z
VQIDPTLAKDLKKAFRYIPTQFAGSIAASGVYLLLRQSLFIPQPGTGVSMTLAIIVEILFTFLLAFVVLHVAATNKTKGNQYFGIAIGFALMVGAFAGGPISGGAFNPAVGLGPLLFDIANISSHLASFTIYLIGPFVGGYLAGFIYNTIFKNS